MRTKKAQQAREMHEANPALTVKQIADALVLSDNQVRQALKPGPMKARAKAKAERTGTDPT